MAINNPLRYPGAKSKLIPYIQNLIQTENLTGCTFWKLMVEVPLYHLVY